MNPNQISTKIIEDELLEIKEEQEQILSRIEMLGVEEVVVEGEGVEEVVVEGEGVEEVVVEGEGGEGGEGKTSIDQTGEDIPKTSATREKIIDTTLETLAKKRANTILERLEVEEENRRKKALDSLIKKAEDDKKKLKQIREENEREAKEEKIKEEKKVLLAGELCKLKIDITDLEQMPGYDDLSAGQMYLVLANLKQVTYSNIKERARKDYKKDVEKSGIFGRIWKGMTKKDQIANAEKKERENIEKGGIEIYQNDLTQLIRGMKENRLDVEIIREVNRETHEQMGSHIEIQYINANDEELTPEESQRAMQFNDIATDFSMLPLEWSYESATKEQQKQFENGKSVYLRRRAAILNMRQESGADKKEVLSWMNNIDKKVQYNQFLTAHPEVEEELNKISDRKKTTFIKSLFGERLGYAGIGFGARSVAIKSLSMCMFSLAAAPIIAATIGGILARNRAKDTVEEMEKTGRQGEEVGLIKKGIDNLKKNFVNSEDLVALMDEIIKKIENPERRKSRSEFAKSKQTEDQTDEERKDQLLKRLGILITANKERFKDGFVNFGDEKERLASQLDFFQTLGRAEAVIGCDAECEKVLSEKISELFDLRKEKISKEKKKYINKEMRKGAIIGASFALGGWLIRDLMMAENSVIKGFFGPKSVPKVVVELPNMPNMPKSEIPAVPESEPGTAPIIPETIPEVAPIAPQSLSPEDTIVHKGQGVWHAVHRQLNTLIKNDPDKFAERFDLKTEDFDTSEEKTKVLNKITMNLLTENKIDGDKIIDLDGKTEIRIVNPGTRVILGEDNTISIIDQNNAPAETYETTLGAHETVGGTKHGLAPDKTIIDADTSDVLHEKINKLIDTPKPEAQPETSRNILEELRSNLKLESTDIPYDNSHGLSIATADNNGDGLPDSAHVFDKNNNIITTLKLEEGETGEHLISQAKTAVETFIKDRASDFNTLTGGKITIEDAKLANLDIFSEHKLPVETQAQLTFWSKNTNLFSGPEVAKSFFELSQSSNVPYNTFDFQHAFENMPDKFTPNQEIGYVKIFAGADNQRQDGLTKLFGKELLGGKTDISSSIKKGVLIIKDAFGHKGYNILLSQDKIGVDGEGLLNWGTKGHLGKIRPDNTLTPDMINMAKDKIEGFVKMMEKKPVNFNE